MTKGLPVWFGIVGIEKKFATAMGIEHFMRDNGLSIVPIQAFQKINNEWVEIQHKVTGKSYQL